MNQLLCMFGQASKFHTSVKVFDEKSVVPKSSATTPPKVEIGKSYLTPSILDKYILLWAKKYKSQAEIPNLVPVNIYNHARNVARIKLANYTIVAVLIGCCYMVYAGKRDKAAGNTLFKKSMDWHAELRKEKEEEDRAAAARGKQ